MLVAVYHAHLAKPVQGVYASADRPSHALETALHQRVTLMPAARAIRELQL